MSDLLTRRRFIASLAASVVAAGAPLPVGFPRKPLTIAWYGTMYFAIVHPDWVKHLKTESNPPRLIGGKIGQSEGFKLIEHDA